MENSREEDISHEMPGHGMPYEADGQARTELDSSDRRELLSEGIGSTNRT